MIVQTHFVTNNAILSAISVGLLYVTGCSVAPSTAKPDSNTITIPTIPATQANPDTQALTTRSLDKALQKCASEFLEKTQPTMTAKLSQKTYPLCFNGFAVMYSDVTKTPIWVAEHLTRQR
ncbi:MAG: hypothetical protein VB956_11240, partial [Moraxella sp.]